MLLDMFGQPQSKCKARWEQYFGTWKDPMVISEYTCLVRGAYRYLRDERESKGDKPIDGRIVVTEVVTPKPGRLSRVVMVFQNRVDNGADHTHGRKDS